MAKLEQRVKSGEHLTLLCHCRHQATRAHGEPRCQADGIRETIYRNLGKLEEPPELCQKPATSHKGKQKTTVPHRKTKILSQNLRGGKSSDNTGDAGSTHMEIGRALSEFRSRTD